MSRNNEFHSGRTFEHAPLEEFLNFASQRPATASARELLRKSIPADLGMSLDHNGNLYRDAFGSRPPDFDTPQKVMDSKYEKAEARGIKDDVLARGVINPIRMVADGATAPKTVYDQAGGGHGRPRVPLLWNGQHRVAVMLRHNPDAQIPLEWGSYEDFDSSPNVNKRYNKPIPTSDKPVRLPKRKKS